MVGFAIGYILVSIWIAFEMWRAPMINEDTGMVIKKGKKISDLFKKNNKNK